MIANHFYWQKSLFPVVARGHVSYLRMGALLRFPYKEKGRLMKLAETLEHISTIAFPDIHCDWHTIDSEARPSAIFEALKKWNEVGNFVHDNFKEGISLLVSTIKAGIFDNETKSVAMQLLAALCEEGAGYCRNEQYRSGTRNEVILDLFQSNDMFVRTVIDNSLYTPTLNAALLAESFFHLDESSFKTVCDKCIRDQFQTALFRIC